MNNESILVEIDPGATSEIKEEFVTLNSFKDRLLSHLLPDAPDITIGEASPDPFTRGGIVEIAYEAPNSRAPTEKVCCVTKLALHC